MMRPVEIEKEMNGTCGLGRGYLKIASEPSKMNDLSRQQSH